MAVKRKGLGIFLIVLGVMAASFASLIVLVTIFAMIEGDFEILIGGLVLGVPAILIAVVLIKGGLKNYRGTGSTVRASGTLPVSISTVPMAETESGDQILEVTTIAGDAADEYEMPAAPATAVVPAAIPAQTAVPAPAPAPAPAGGSRTGLFAPENTVQGFAIEKAVIRSNDVFATLKDFIAHPQQDPSDAALASMLESIGLPEWSDAPKIEAVKLGRSNSFWLGANNDGLSDEAYDRFLGIECALNVNQAMRLKGCSALEVMQGTLDLEARDTGRVLPGIAEGALEQGEWMQRQRFAEFAENVPVPFRAAFGMQANAAAGLFVIDLTIPRPASMAFIAANRAGCICAARAYALRSALLFGHKAFELNPEVRRVVVNCGVPRGTDTLLSLDLDRASLRRLLPAAHDPQIDTVGFPSDPSIRVRFDEEGWFLPVDAFMPIDDRAASPSERFVPVEVDPRLSSKALTASCGARINSELGIYEHAVRSDAWDRLVASPSSTTGEMVAQLVSIRDTARDVSVAEAAERTSKALVEGTVDVSDLDALRKLFVEGSLLDTVASAAQAALDDPEHADLEAQLAAIDEALAPLTAMGVYLDDSETVYRYFNSAIERVWFNLNLDDRSRVVKLVPDSYYTAHSCAARILSMLDRGEEALAHADELVRIAPATPDAALVRVRVLENMSRTYDAADLLEEAITRCSTSRDLAICFYRLAYMEWKRGRSDLSVACYERSIALGTPLMEQAKDELADLLESDPSLKHLSEEEAIAVLKEAGIPVGDPEALRMMAARAAIAATDSNLFGVAASLTGTLIDARRDDVLVDIYHSLRVGI